MFQMKPQLSLCALTVAGVLASGGLTSHADDDRQGGRDRGDGLRTIFVIAMENHNWTQPASMTSPQAIFTHPDAPFINSLVSGTSGISKQVAYATNYLNAGAGVHPSEPNYIWAEAGSNLGVFRDDEPYHAADCSPDTVQDTDQHLSAFLMRARKRWRSYQEDADVDLATNLPLPKSAWTVPLFNLSGAFSDGLNAYNYATQYNYAAKHNPQIFFVDTSGGCDTTPTNRLRRHYAPLQQLAIDLQNDDVAQYNWITPNLYNDMHNALTNGYGGPVGSPNHDDRAHIAQGDNFLARIVPLIMASKAYQNHGAILLWWDESEGGDTPDFTLPFIVISKDVRENVGGLPFASSIEYSHSSTLRTMQEVFDVDPDSGYPWLGAAATATDLSALFNHRAIR